jgi:uncharacterized protein YciI
MPEDFEPMEGMTVYYMGIISRGPEWTQEETPQTIALQEQHLAYIDTLSKDGVMVLAGPFLHDGTMRGIFLFKTDSFDAAKKLSQNDPAVKAGRLIVDVYPWMVPLGKLP